MSLAAEVDRLFTRVIGKAPPPVEKLGTAEQETSESEEHKRDPKKRGHIPTSKVAKMWLPFRGPRGGLGARNPETGEVLYGKKAQEVLQAQMQGGDVPQEAQLPEDAPTEFPEGMRSTEPGKYTSELDAIIDEEIGGDADDEISTDDQGWWGLVRRPFVAREETLSDLTEEERAFLAQQKAIILHERNDGSFDATYYEDEQEALEDFENVRRHVGAAEGEEDPDETETRLGAPGVEPSAEEESAGQALEEPEGAEEPAADMPSEDDIFTNDGKEFYHLRRVIARDPDELREWMEQKGFFPNIWMEGERGDTDLYDPFEGSWGPGEPPAGEMVGDPAEQLGEEEAPIETVDESDMFERVLGQMRRAATGPGQQARGMRVGVADPTQAPRGPTPQQAKVPTERAHQFLQDAIRADPNLEATLQENDYQSSETMAAGIARYLVENQESPIWSIMRTGEGLAGEQKMLKQKCVCKPHYQILHKSETEFIIYGPASVAIVDREGDRIAGPALKEALPQLFRRKRFSLQHLDILVGEILRKWKNLETTVRPVVKGDMDMFPWLAEKGVSIGDDALFAVGNVYGDTEYCLEVRKKAEEGEINSFSVSGQALASSRKMDCKGFECKVVNEISKIDLSAITLCREGMNQASKFIIVSKAMLAAAGLRGFVAKATPKKAATRGAKKPPAKPRRDYAEMGRIRQTPEHMRRPEGRAQVPEGEVATAEGMKRPKPRTMPGASPTITVSRPRAEKKPPPKKPEQRRRGPRFSPQQAAEEVAGAASPQTASGAGAQQAVGRLIAGRPIGFRPERRTAPADAETERPGKVSFPSEGSGRSGPGEKPRGMGGVPRVKPPKVTQPDVAPPVRRATGKTLEEEVTCKCGGAEPCPCEGEHAHAAEVEKHRMRRPHLHWDALSPWMKRRMGRWRKKMTGLETELDALLKKHGGEHGQPLSLEQLFGNNKRRGKRNRRGKKLKDVAIVLDHLLQREAKPTPRNHKRSSPSTSVPRDAVVTDVPIGKPKTPRGPTIGVFVSDDSAMKPPAHADDPEWYEHPSGSDRVKDSANAGDATGKRPHGFYRRMVDDLDALLTKRRKKKDPFAEDPEDAIIEDTMRHASGTFPEDPEDPLGAVHDFSEAVAGEVNEKLGRRRRRRAQKASEGGGGSEGMTPTPIVQRDDEKPRKVVEHRYEQAGETPEGFARIRFSEKPREEKQVSPGGVGGMKAVTTDPAARIRGEGADMHPSDESELTRRRAMAKPTAKAGEKKPKDELEEMAASQKKETRAFEREEMKKAGDKDDEREHKVEALIDGELVQKPGEGHEHDAKMEECIEKVKANTPEGRDPDEFAHRVCYATMGKSYLENYNPNCPACFKTMRDLEDPDSYFAALRKAVKTGIVEPFRVHPADSGRFKSEVRVIATVAGQLVKAAATASEASA